MHLSRNVIGLIICCLFLLIPIYLLITQASIASTGVEVEATVIELTQKRHKNKTTFYPVVEFYLEGGGTQTTQLHSGSNPSFYQVGDPIAIIYSRENPKEVVVNNKFVIYGIPIIMLVFLAGFIIGLLSKIKKERAENG
ncbi:MAG: DUF3592 domain-containing protein [Aureispira sp.]